MNKKQPKPIQQNPKRHQAPKAVQTGQVVALNEYGDGEVHGHRRIVKLARALPGDQVKFRVGDAEKSHVYGELLQLIKPSPSRVDPQCPAFAQGCGGCQWLHLDYTEQLRWKTKILRDILHERCQPSIRVNEIIGLDNPFGFRNKLSLRNLNGRFAQMQDFGEQVIATPTCRVELPALQALREAVFALEIPRDILQLHARGDEAGGVGVCFFVARQGPKVREFAQLIATKVSSIRGIGAQCNDNFELLSGSAYIEFRDLGLEYRIPLNGFFQTNYGQARRLRALAIEQLAVGKSDRVLDLYCGCGFFTLPLGLSGARVVGIENNPASTANAAANAAANGLSNVNFITADVGAALSGFKPGEWDQVLLDPPRQGCEPLVLQELCRLAVKRLVYISCLPASLARDLKVLLKAGYRVTACQPLDMFPQTAHLETVVCLQLGSLR